MHIETLSLYKEYYREAKYLKLFKHYSLTYHKPQMMFANLAVLFLMTIKSSVQK